VSELEGESEPLTDTEPVSERVRVTDPVADTLTDSLLVTDALGDTLLVAQGEDVYETDGDSVDESDGVPDSDALPEELPITDVESVAVPHAVVDIVIDGDEVVV
jgi:hypothetical protein